MSYLFEVYGLSCSCAYCLPEFRYIGYTARTSDIRKQDHLQEAEGSGCRSCAKMPDTQRCAKCSWVLKHGANNIQVSVISQRRTRAEATSEERRVIRIFNTFHGDNYRGLNLTRGGDGGNVYEAYSEEQHAKKFQKMSELMKSIWAAYSPEEREQRLKAQAAGLRKHFSECSEEDIAKRVEALNGGKHQKHQENGVDVSYSCSTCLGKTRDEWTKEDWYRSSVWTKHTSSHVVEDYTSLTCEFCVETPVDRSSATKVYANRPEERRRRSEVRSDYRHREHTGLGYWYSWNCGLCIGVLRSEWTPKEQRRASAWIYHRENHNPENPGPKCRICLANAFVGTAYDVDLVNTLLDAGTLSEVRDFLASR